MSSVDQNGKVPSAAKVARLVPDALREACLRPVALTGTYGEILLTVLVTER